MEYPIAISGQITDKINFAMQQNYIPVIRSLVLTNTSEKKLEHVTLRITFEPAFAKTFETEISVLEPEQPVEIAPVRILLSPEYLYSLTEKIVGSVHIEVTDAETVLYAKDKEISLFAYDQWLGVLVMPEMTAAFITPNHPRIAQLTAKAGLFLQQWTGDPAFTGYQSKNPNLVKKQAAAIYAALQAENIAYTVPPASYESLGQRVRLPHTVLEQKCGTCLDLSLLFAACCEAVGLFPLVVFIDGHAFAGVWLEEETFGECVEEDMAALTKRVAEGIDTLCLVECTDYTAGKNTAFDLAEKHAKDHLLRPEEFTFALDISRCRCSGIRPMPVRICESGVFSMVDYGKHSKNEITSAPREIDLSQRTVAASEGNVTRQSIWERKLLDINLKNSLLNFRPSASNIQFMTSSLSALEDHIAGGEDFKIMPAPQDVSFAMSDSRIFEIENEVDMITAIADAEFQKKRLRTFISPSELEKILKKLHRQAKVSLEENGANTLYLALGLLRWFETDRSDRPRYAPLVLIPVDIIRKIQDKSYALRVRDEETQMNITLIEMLRQNFEISITGLSPLPMDESGVDLPLVFNTIRSGVMAKKRWDIVETAFLGQFSFSHFIMWNDIRSRSEELARNKTVASIISGKLEWSPQNIELTPAELDAALSPADMAIPMSVDSSQLAAVHLAAKGESFVLHGPPGTGKSQTITNMIANALYNGKSVLFVAEKMAALSVVQKRLASIGLDPFCLELHSNKSQKKAVLGQLEQALAAGRIKAPEEYERTAQQLHALRKELNSTMQEIHRVRSIGFSLYDAVVNYDRCSQYKDAMSIPVETAANMDPYRYEQCMDTLKNTAALGRECGGYAASPLRNYHRQDYSLEIRSSFEKTAKEFTALLSGVKAHFEALLTHIGCGYNGSCQAYGAAIRLLSAAAGSDYFPEAVSGDLILRRKNEVDTLLADGRDYVQQTAALSANFENSIFTIDPAEARLQWKRNEQKWFLPKALGKRRLVKELALHGKTPSAVTAENYPQICEQLENYAQLRSRIQSADAALTSIFGASWKAEQSDFAQLEAALTHSLQMKPQLELLSRNGAEYAAMLQKLAGDSTFRSTVQSMLAGFESERIRLDEVLHTLTDTYCIDLSQAMTAPCWFDAADTEARGWLSGIELLRERSSLEKLLAELRSLGVPEAADAFVSGNVDESGLCDAFVCAVSRSVISHVFASCDTLAQFQSTQFDAKLEKYREITERFRQLTIQELAARLSARIPDTSAGTGAGSSELSLLQKAIRSGGRMLPIRKLFDSIPNLLRRICPCMLMSPLSVAQYIDPSFPKFDLVIFDEASQLPTSEAVGAIARGENVIVVGDPKQLPPTSFFASNQVDEENYDKEDLESVLDDCLALAMPQKHLLWHYRSRHESLIAFSNAKFYGNHLLTFPSPADIVSEVKWINVEGFYDKGKTKQNRAEAEAVVAEIVRRLNDPVLRRQSIGVVTFSLVQQNLIDDLLAEEYLRQPQLEQYANEMYEPIFIKNLENVQGDERDVILFSIGYGPDQEGKVSMNFGPVNRDGGWRRLNVAVSRARRQMMVFSVIRPEQIDLSRTRSDGVAQLKAFLEYAAKGRSALAVNPAERTEFSEQFALAAADALRKEGFDVRCGIGCSGYKIDIGIVNPEKPSEYLLAVMCDSKGNAKNTTSRDRNILQPDVLRGLGWNVCSIHVLDWLDNKQRVIERIRAEMEQALERWRSAPEEALPQPVKAQPVQFEKQEPLETVQQEIYTPCQLSVMGTPEQFYAPAARTKIAGCIRKIVEAEAPVSRRAVEKKILAAWGISRSGSRVSQVFEDALQLTDIRRTRSNQKEFFWKKEQDPVAYSSCRIPGSDEKRSLEDICAEELCEGVLTILRTQIAMQRSDLIRETAKLFGFNRTGGVIETSVSAGIACAVQRGLVCEEAGGKIRLIS